jgi:hypothetical protein
MFVATYTPMKKIIFYLLIINIASCKPEPQGDPVELKLLYNKGDKFSLLSITEVTTDMDESNLHYESRLLFSVDSVLEKTGEYLLSAKVDYIILNNTSNMAMDNESYNSNKDESIMNDREKLLHTEFNPLLDSTLYLKLNNKNKIVTPFSFKSNLRLPKGTDPVDITNAFIPFPEKPVRQNEEWTSEKTNALTGAKVTSTYSIADIKKGVVRINYTGKITGLPGPNNTMTGVYELTQENNRLEIVEIDMDVKTMFGGKGKMKIRMYSK